MCRVLPLLLITLLVGCDTGYYGIHRYARVSFMPELDKVGVVVRETPGVDDVQYRATAARHPIPLPGIMSQVHTFSYRGASNVHGSLSFILRYKGTVEYSQSLLTRRRPPQEWINATRPVMLQIETRLEQSCGLTNLQASVDESCVGVKCK